MRKRIVGELGDGPPVAKDDWLDLEKLADVEITSEDPEHPIENALTTGASSGWRASSAGPQTIRISFAEPRPIRHIHLHFIENERERQHEFVLCWSANEGEPMREIVRQQYHFSPGGAVEEVEDFKVNLRAVGVLELRIIPERSGGNALASLARMRLA